VIVHLKSQAPGQAVDRPLQVAIVKGHEPPARVAQEVMVMGAGGIDQLVADGGVAQLQAANQPSLLQKFEDAVDARASHTTTVPATKAVLDLEHAERAGLFGEEVDDRVACPASAMSGLIENRPSVL
jgi:hypothetical protein